MPRTPLAAISPNITSRKKLTPMQRAKIEGAAAFGATPGQISKAFSIPRPTIYCWKLKGEASECRYALMVIVLLDLIYTHTIYYARRQSRKGHYH